MAYTSQGLIEASDFNNFATSINAVWSTGTTSSGYGQTALASVTGGVSVVQAPPTVSSTTQWAGLVNIIASMAAHQGTTITARTAPVAGNVIAVLANVSTDITNCTTNKGNAVASGTQYTGWTGTNSNTAGKSGASWSITFTNTVTFASADAARYFFNAGGRIKLDVSKTATGQTGDPEWNDLANTLCGDIYITGGAATQTIAGTAYTGTTKIGGTGTPNTLATTTGWFDLTAGAAATIVYKQFADTAPYTANYIQHSIAKNAGSTALTITTLWQNTDSDPISGGTAASGATPGTGACTICTYFPPSTTYLTNTWGTPTVAATTV